MISEKQTELLINASKSNNSEVISNKQIDEMVEFLNNRINVERNSYFGKGCITIPIIEADKILDILKGYRKQGEWVSVDERLPSEEEQRDEYGELVPFLVCEKDTTYPYRAFYDGTEWGDGLMKIRRITHWMPLPQPPKGRASNDS